MALNYSDSANTEDGSCYYSPGCTNPIAFNYNADADFDDGSCIIYGCIDNLACNYNENATDDDGTCVLLDGICETCSEDGLSAVDNDLDDDGVCDADEVAGCQDNTACNYNENATDDDGSCLFVDGVCETCSGETDGNGTIVDNDLDDDDVCDADEVSGCQDNTACNYNENATDDDGSCLYYDAIDVCGGDCPLDADDDGVCDAIYGLSLIHI